MSSSTDESYKLDEVGMRVPDLQNLVEVLNLVLNKQQAEDLAKCYNNLVDVRYSPLTKEVEAIRDRADGLLTDYWAERGKELAQGVAAQEAEVEEEPEQTPDDIELPGKPFGAVEVNRAPMLEFTDEQDAEDEDAGRPE